MTKRKPKYLKILEGMNCCYGCSSDDRNCGNCPYDKYNDRDFYGQGTSFCMEKLNEDAKKWTETMTMFCNCRDCCCWHKELDENENWRFVDDDKVSDGFCSVWKVMTYHTEYCSRGAMKD
jgi:hypothetical protein